CAVRLQCSLTALRRVHIPMGSLLSSMTKVRVQTPAFVVDPVSTSFRIQVPVWAGRLLGIVEVEVRRWGREVIDVFGLVCLVIHIAGLDRLSGVTRNRPR